MDPKRNPFVPSAGANPPELAGRQGILDMADVLLDRTKEGRIGRNFIMYGLRGVGKTVLLVKIDQLAEEKGYSVVHLEGGENQSVNPRFAQELRKILLSMTTVGGIGKKLRYGIGVLLSYLEMLKISTNNVNIEIKPNHGVADTGDITEDISALLLTVAEAAKENNNI